jgi:RNA polymerase sigma factor (sigma-70 family)
VAVADPLDTADLVALAANGEQAAWDQLVDRYAGLVWSVIRGHGLYGEPAADVSQTAWLRLVEHLGRLRDPERVGAWLATTARHECLRVLRKAGRQVLVADVPEQSDERADAEIDADLLAGERRDAALAALAAAPPRCQELLRLLLVDPPLSYDEISDILGIPKGSIGPTRARCLDHVRSRLPRRRINEPPKGS